MKQSAMLGVINPGMRIKVQVPRPVLNPAYKRFQPLPEPALLLGLEGRSSRARSAPLEINCPMLHDPSQLPNRSAAIYASSE